MERRATLEKLAAALRVAPSDLMGTPWISYQAGAQTQAGVVDLEAALDRHEFGEDPGVAIRDWPEIDLDVDRLVHHMHVTADYAAQAALTPDLIAELHAAYVRLPEHRPRVLLGLMHCYSSICWVTKRFGGRGLPLLAARLAQHCADELGVPEWRGYATWLRGDAAGDLSRAQQYRRAVSMADELVPELHSPDVQQAYGMLHLSAALASAAQSDRDTADTHLDEASAVASRMNTEVGTFARMWFGTANVGVWRTSMATEFGDGPKVAEIARGVNVDAIPSLSRRAEFYADLGRSLMQERKTRGEGVAVLLRAEELAPQRIRNDAFTQEAVSNQVRAMQREAGGPELRGLAHRMGLGE